MKPLPTAYKPVDAYTTSGTADPAAPLDPKDYEIAWLKLRNEQLHHRVAVLEQQFAESKQ